MMAIGALTAEQIEGSLSRTDVEVLASELTGDLRRELRSMQQGVSYGDETTYGDMVRLCRAVQAEARRQEAETIAKIGHAHVWGDNDLCEICGVDGRS